MNSISPVLRLVWFAAALVLIAGAASTGPEMEVRL